MVDSGRLENVYLAAKSKVGSSICDLPLYPTLTFIIVSTQYAHNVVLTSIRRCFNVLDVVWTSTRRRVLTG